MKFFSNEKGQMMIVFALGFAIFCGFAGLTIDAGNMYWQKSILQTSLDAACLAGAQELTGRSADTVNAKTKFWEYTRANRISDSEIDLVQTSVDYKTIYAQGTRPVDIYLLPVLGFNREQVVVAKAAATKKVDNVFNYLLFNGSRSLPMDISMLNGDLTGSIHSNDDIVMHVNNFINISENCEAVGDISIDAHIERIHHLDDEADIVPMPPYAAKILAEVPAEYNFTGDQVWEDIPRIDASDPVFVNGDLTMTPNNLIGPGAIVATGDIIIDTNNLMSHGTDLFIYSISGNITITGNNTKISGIFYAPSDDPNGIITVTKGTDEHPSNNIDVQGAQFIGNQVIFDQDLNGIRMGGLDNSSVWQYGNVSLVPYPS